MARLRTITVGELRALLEDREADELVIFTADYGDRGHTAQALPLDGEVEEVTVRETGYSNSGYAVVDPEDRDEDDEDEDDAQEYLLIR